MKPKVLFVGKGRLSLPLPTWLQKKWDALSDVFELRVLNAGTGSGDARFRMLPERARSFYPRLPFEIARSLRAFPADVIVASDPFLALAAHVGRALARSRAKIVVEVHGDPRTFTRAYGSPARKALAPFADIAARYGIRGADATRALSHFTSSLIEDASSKPATAQFPTYSDLSAFAEPPTTPIPEARRVVFVGALEPYKNVVGLAAAWRQIAAELPDAKLVVIGQGSQRSVIERLLADLPEHVEHHPVLAPSQLVTQIDAARALVLPSWPEGLGRVVLEAFARARPVVGTDGGGIPDIVTDESDGLLIPRADTAALVVALRRVLEDKELCERLGAAARETYAKWHQTPAQFAQAYRDLVDQVRAGAP